MGKMLALAIVAVALLFGCAQVGKQNNGTVGAEGTPYSAGALSVPQSPVSYTARYAISDAAGGEAEKTVWRMKDMMRMRMGAGNAAVDVFFLGTKAYSCPVAPNPECYDISGKVGGMPKNDLFPSPPEGRAPDGTVDIGGTLGNCYVDFAPPAATRKRCFTATGVLAYDEYNATSTQSHVEYLTDLSYAASETDFALPAAPLAAPN